MRKFQVLTVIAASTALAMGTVPAFAEDASDEVGELPVDEGAPVGYEDGSEVSDPADEVVDDAGEVVDEVVDEPTGEIVDDVVEGEPGTGEEVQITVIDDTGMIDDGGVVDDGGIIEDGGVDPVEEVVVKDDLGVPDEEVAVRDGDPLPYERNLDDPEVIYYMTGGPAGGDFGDSAADDAAEAAADNAADKALERVEVAASSSRTPATAE